MKEFEIDFDYTDTERGDTDFENRMVSTSYSPSDEEAENSLRPRRMDEYIGQDKAKENLKVYIEAAKMRGDSLDHVLLYGPPGLGKTTLSGIIAAEMGVNLRVTSGPAIEKQGDLAALLTNLNPGDVLFIDEIHRLPRMVEEILYPAMEDYALDIIIGKGPAARSIRIDLPKFTLIGATTRAGQLTTPLRDRFGVLLKLELYTPEQLAEIVRRSASILGIPISEDGAYEIASRSRGTPRIANRLLKRVRDFAMVQGKEEIAGSTRDRRAGLGQHRPPDDGGHHQVLRGWSGWSGHPGRDHRRGGHYHRGCVRALPHAAGLHSANPPRSLRDPPRVRAFGSAPARIQADQGCQRSASLL